MGLQPAFGFSIVASMFDEELPKKKPGFAPLKLDDMSIGELKDYIALLNEEIRRVEADIAKKDFARAVADKFFK